MSIPTNGGHAKKERFLEAVALTGNISTAAKAAGCARQAHYNWLDDDEAYPARFTAAMDQAADLLEQEARRRAVAGIDKPIYQGGQQVGTVRQYSDLLLIFLMKGAMPEKYRERIDQRTETVATVHVTAGVRQQLLNDQDYLEYQRHAALNADAGDVRPDSEQRALEDGTAPGHPRPGANGTSGGKK